MLTSEMKSALSEVIDSVAGIVLKFLTCVISGSGDVLVILDGMLATQPDKAIIAPMISM